MTIANAPKKKGEPLNGWTAKTRAATALSVLPPKTSAATMEKAPEKPVRPTPPPAPGIKDPQKAEALYRRAALKARLQERSQAVILPVLALLVICVLWEAYSRREGVILPGPIAMVKESWAYIAHPFFDRGENDKGLGWHILLSLQRVALGWGLAALVGSLVGLALGRFLWLYRAFDPLFQVLRTVPPLAWLPISLAVFNEAQPSAIFVIFITAIWPVILNTCAGVQRLPQEYQHVARIYQIRGWRYLAYILLPATAPYLFTGLRISIGMAWLAIVASEMLTGGVGIGFFIWDSWNSSRLSDILVSVLYVGLIGLALDRLVAQIARLVGAQKDGE